MHGGYLGGISCLVGKLPPIAPSLRRFVRMVVSSGAYCICELSPVTLLASAFLRMVQLDAWEFCVKPFLGKCEIKVDLFSSIALIALAVCAHGSYHGENGIVLARNYYFAELKQSLAVICRACCSGNVCACLRPWSSSFTPFELKCLVVDTVL